MKYIQACEALSILFDIKTIAPYLARHMILKLFSLIVLVQILAASALSACNVPIEELRTVTLPIDYTNKTIRFKALVRIIIRNPKAPYLLVIPGGPGTTIMETDLKLFPKQLNILLVDPRTIGCNQGLRI